MNWDSIDQSSELRCRLAAAFWKCRGQFHQYKRICEWLDCYQYILPDARRIHPQIVYTDAGLFFYWQFTDLLQCCLTIDEQVIVWKLIKESSTLVTRPATPSTSVPANSNCIV